jgi:excisionase family DNA binding protein
MTKPSGAAGTDTLVKQTYNVEEAGKILGLNRQAAYFAVRRGEIPVIRFGGRMKVSKLAIDRILQGAQ